MMGGNTMKSLVSQKVQRMGDCLNHYQSLLSQYQQETRPISKKRIEKEVNVAKRRLNALFQELGSMGKGIILEVEYTCTWQHRDERYKEEFIGLNSSEIDTIFRFRDFIYKGTHQIISIKEKFAEITKIG